MRNEYFNVNQTKGRETLRGFPGTRLVGDGGELERGEKDPPKICLQCVSPKPLWPEVPGAAPSPPPCSPGSRGPRPGQGCAVMQGGEAGTEPGFGVGADCGMRNRAGREAVGDNDDAGDTVRGPGRA